MKHSRSAYVHGLCRCDVCRTAHAEYEAGARRLRYAITGETGLPANVKHGLSAYVNWGCRCPTCKAYASENNKNRVSRPGATRDGSKLAP